MNFLTIMKKLRILMIISFMGLLGFSGCSTEKQESPEVLSETTIEKVWPGHEVGFSLKVLNENQYVAYYNDARKMTVASRKGGDEKWRFKRLDSQLGWDSHNYVTMGFDREGHLHVSGNMHVDPLVYFKSDKPYDIESLKPVHEMTGRDEERVTYPRFLNDNNGRLVFMYRDGSSGNGRRLINVYDEDTQTWSRLIDRPLLDGHEQDMNAYPNNIVKGPKGWFHLVWMWRNTPDCRTNHDISYARSRNLEDWETAAGEKITLPITPEDKETIVDPVPSKSGLINMGFGIGFDPQDRQVIHYHNYDSAGNSQIFLARWKNSDWEIKKISSWDYRWDFKGGGAIPSEISANPVRVLSDGRFVISWEHIKYGEGTWELDPHTLQVVQTVDLPPRYPENLQKPKSEFPNMKVHWRCKKAADDASSNIKYCIRWETLPPHRDRPREGPLPDPSTLKLYKMRMP